MKNLFTFAVIAIACFLMGAYAHQQQKKEITWEDLMYAKWSACVEACDGSDSACEECDLKYNPNGLPFDMRDSSRLSDLK